MEKLDLAKKYPEYYRAAEKPGVVVFEPVRYLSIAGSGDPSGPLFSGNIEALYTVAYGIKFIYKNLQKDFTVPKLEGLWWFDMEKYSALTLDTAPAQIPRSEWHCRLLLRLPDYVKEESLEQAINTSLSKKKTEKVKEVLIFELNEGKCVQALHTGAFNKEPETLKKIQDFINEKGLKLHGLHHEIYLSDFRKTVPEKLKTILREPVV